VLKPQKARTRKAQEKIPRSTKYRGLEDIPNSTHANVPQVLVLVRSSRLSVDPWRATI